MLEDAMGRKVVFSAILVAGLVQWTPAFAQLQQDGAVTPPAAAPMPVVKIAEVKPREPDLADKDLAAVPPEEIAPAMIDPNKARHGLASVTRRAAPAAAPVREAPRSEVAVAARGPRPAPARAAAPAPARIERVAEARPAPIAPALVTQEGQARPDLAVAERVVRQAQADHNGGVVMARASRAPAARPQPNFDEPEAEPALAERMAAPARTVEEAPKVLPAEQVAEEVREGASVHAERVAVQTSAPEVELPAPRPAIEVATRASRPVYSEEPEEPEEPIAERPVYAREERLADEAVEEPAPVYAEDVRDETPAYPQGEPTAAPVYAERDPRDDRRYALDDRAVRPVAYPMARARGMSPEDRACSSSRAAALQQRVRREAARGLIDWQIAQDIDDEIIHTDDMRSSYCASGMNDWREERLERQYAMIEDRIRYEEARRER